MAGDNHNISSTTAPSKAVTWTTMNSSHVNASSDGILLASGARLLIGTPDITPTSATVFHENGQFNLGNTGTVEVTVSYTRTGGGGNLWVYLNSANTTASAACVHGVASGGSANPDDFSFVFPVSTNNTVATNKFIIELEKLAARSTASANALNSSFFQFRNANDTTYTIHSIKIEKIAPPGISDITVTGSHAVMSGNGNVGSGGQINLNAAKVPHNAVGELDITWSVKTTNNPAGADATFVTILPHSDLSIMLKATDALLTADAEVWVFATDSTLGITSTGHKVDVLMYDVTAWIPLWAWDKEDHTGNAVTIGQTPVSVNDMTLRTATNVNVELTSAGIVLPQNGRLLIGTNENIVTTATTFHPNAELDFGVSGRVRVTVKGTKSNIGWFSIFLNSCIIDAGASYIGVHAANLSNSFRQFTAATTAIDDEWIIDLNTLAALGTHSEQALYNSFFMLRTQNTAGATISIDSISIEYNILPVEHPLTGFTITGPDFINAGDGTTGSGDKVTLTANPLPANANDGPYTWVWSINDSNTPSEETSVFGVASINSTTGELTAADIIPNDRNVWVFLREATRPAIAPVSRMIEIRAQGKPLTGITIQGDNTVTAGDGDEVDGESITLSAIPVPIDAVGDPFTFTWGISLTNVAGDASASIPNVATITSGGVLTATNTDITADIPIYVFASTGGITSDGYLVTVKKYVPPATGLPLFEWNRANQTESFTFATSGGNNVAREINGKNWRSASGSITVSSEGITLGGNGRIVIGTNSVDATTSDSFHEGGEFVLGTSGIIQVTVNFSKNAAGNFILYLNNSTTSNTTSVHGNNANSVIQDAGDGATSITWNINLATLAALANVKSAEALNSSFFQLRSASGVTTIVESIVIERVE
jgi:hypothetical protein